MPRRFYPVKDAPAGTVLPKRGTAYSAGYDFVAPEDIYCPAHGFSRLVFTNVKCQMEPDEYLALMVRSSLAIKNPYLLVSQGTAVIDADYFSNPKNDGNIGVVFENRSDFDYTIDKGERCCQGIFQKYFVTDNDAAAGDRTGGMGSTGK